MEDLDFSVNMWPVFGMLVKVILCLAIPGFIAAILTSRFPDNIGRIAIRMSILGGMYVCFKYVI
ncbi:hypothetical protein EEL32_00280 (plasmid) [Brevibacillus laterosporus]|uniref:Uncharacterized protein n=1 Tax=Brevibacillus laterosporus TaxID=1465 RepID=A0A502J5Z7_BRELA|nr:hypothetical protein EEL30_00975 [Brevibacillus laterosporus]TPG70763.1 hypothetical protein EEL31_21500 [Brevibacillus laterosporus]TPG93528.1 hypothetical protein EEL32_00280 [Brevibacillus laterosporus]